MKNKKESNMFFSLMVMVWGICFSMSCHAGVIIIEGAVADEVSKQILLQKLKAVYGDQVVDKITVRAVQMPQAWNDTVGKMINPELKKISGGQLSIRGTQVKLTGNISQTSEIQPLNAVFQSQIPASYTFSSALKAVQSEQKLVDDALANRIIEFESGSAVLTVAGMKILDEMVIALNRVQNKNVRITGHTDSSGEPEKNRQLSLARADAVKKYLTANKIASVRLTVYGAGSEQPVAENDTVEGRKKNRRIEFNVL